MWLFMKEMLTPCVRLMMMIGSWTVYSWGRVVTGESDYQARSSDEKEREFEFDLERVRRKILVVSLSEGVLRRLRLIDKGFLK
ncbi:hypothetical protein EDB19DRAFT_218058 [Suillus lakei]|nr:hypothetical protein EDB19DRAFT_218058 [Suillus lakei]